MRDHPRHVTPTTFSSSPAPLHSIMSSSILILIGGGHAHLQVITAPLPTPSTTRILISDSPTAVYSGMLPAVVAGLTPFENSVVDLSSLCATNNTTFIHATVTRILPQSSKIFFQPYSTTIECSLSYHYLSINVGSTAKPIHPTFSLPETNTSALPIVIPTRPIANLDPAICAFESHASASLPIIVIGAGAAGIELALALSTRFPSAPVTLISRAHAFASQFGRMAGHTVIAELQSRNVHLILGRSVISISRETHTITLDDAQRLPFALAVLATGAAPHAWLQHTGLHTDPDGWLLADPTLKCVGLDNVFAAGDCVSFGDTFRSHFPPKAGVYAVRQGPVLAHNLAVAIRNAGKLKQFNPQASFLSLLSTGDGRAIGSKYGIAFKGTWVYRLKNFIDEAWQDRFRIFSKGQSGPSTSGGLEGVFGGSPVEGAAILHVADEISVDDSFEQQLMVLRRMDADEEFREAVVRISLEQLSLVTANR